MNERWSRKADDDYEYLRANDTVDFKRLNRLIDMVKTLPRRAIRPIALTGTDAGWLARHYGNHRTLIYCFRDGDLLIASCR